MAVFKMVMCVRKRADMSRSAFLDYWQNHHGPLVRSWADTLGAYRYVQSPLLETRANAINQAYRGVKAPYDGIAEIWWESEDVFWEAAKRSAVTDMNAILFADEQAFIDMAESALFFTTEITVFDESPA